MAASGRYRLARLALAAAVLAVIVGGWYQLGRDPHAAQDACTFGDVTNARYRDLLAAARRMVDREQPAWLLHAENRDIGRASDLLIDQYRTLASGLDTIPEKTAAMHALARAYGAHFAHTVPDNASPWTVDPATAPESVIFVYALNAGDIGVREPLRQWITINGAFAVRDVSPGFELSKGIAAGTLNMYVAAGGFSPQIAPPPQSLFHACPPVPSAVWQAAFDAPPEPAPAYAAPRTNIDLMVALADSLMERGRPRLALDHLERALALCDHTIGGESETSVAILDRLARTYRAVGQPQRAAEAGGRAIDARIRLGLPPPPVE